MKDLFKQSREAGQAMMIVALFFMVFSVIVIFGIAGPVLKQQAVTAHLNLSRQSYFLAEAGLEDVLYRLKTGQIVGASETLSLNGNTVTTVTTNTLDGKEVIATGDVKEAVRKVEVNLILGVGAAFYYGIQAGQGGFVLGNATVNGNVYSNGTITGENGAKITGSAFSASASGLVDNIDIGANGIGDAWAHTVNNSTVIGNLYCQTGQDNNKSCNTSQSDPEPLDFPITDAQLDEWKADAFAGGTIGSYNPSEDSSLGPKKINGDMTLDDSNLDITVNGVLHVTGNINMSNNQGSVRCAPSFSSNSCIIIADGFIDIKNNITFSGSGQAGSFLLLVSTLDCDGSGAYGSPSGKPCDSNNGAIDLHNNTTGSIIYGPHGKLYLRPGVHITGATAYKIELANNAEANYEQGLANTAFSSGPSGGYEILSWKEIE